MDDPHAPATKGDLRELGEQLRSESKADLKEVEERLQKQLQELGEQLRSEFQHGFDDLKETFRDAQTELLKVFYSFAESNQTRQG